MIAWRGKAGRLDKRSHGAASPVASMRARMGRHERGLGEDIPLTRGRCHSRGGRRRLVRKRSTTRHRCGSRSDSGAGVLCSRGLPCLFAAGRALRQQSSTRVPWDGMEGSCPFLCPRLGDLERCVFAGEMACPCAADVEFRVACCVCLLVMSEGSCSVHDSSASLLLALPFQSTGGFKFNQQPCRVAWWLNANGHSFVLFLFTKDKIARSSSGTGLEYVEALRFLGRPSPLGDLVLLNLGRTMPRGSPY